MQSDMMIEVLPVSLHLVRIPRARVHEHFQPILRQLLQPTAPAFLNVTLNEIELSVFAAEPLADDFGYLAYQDARTARRRRSKEQAFEPIELADDKWKVIQIPSPGMCDSATLLRETSPHPNNSWFPADSSGARVHELSAPIANAGISILYQSSHQSDFIFVSSHSNRTFRPFPPFSSANLCQVKESRLHDVLTLLGNVGFTPFLPDTDYVYLAHAQAEVYSDVVDAGAGAVLTRSHSASVSPTSRTRSNTGTTLDGLAGALVEVCVGGSSPEHAMGSLPSPLDLELDPSSLAPDEACVLAPDLACVGLPNESAEVWTLKLVKLLAFADLITPARIGGVAGAPHQHSRYTDLTSPTRKTHEDNGGGGGGGDSPIGECNGSDSDASSFSSSSESSVSDFDDSRSASELSTAATPSSPSSELPCTEAAAAPLDASRQQRQRRPKRSGRPGPPPPPLAPFFSFTRAAEGASLTAPLSLLAALFPPHERHGLTSLGELDAFDDAAEDEDEDGSGDAGANLTRCLQLDLRRFPLDEHGLVHRFSRALAKHGIAHMYSATYKTANLIVSPSTGTHIHTFFY
jgi:hypothetical protein